MGEPYRTPEQPSQYPSLQEGAGINGPQAAHVVEVANIINGARDTLPHASDTEAAELQDVVDGANEHIDAYLGDAALHNLAQRSPDPEPDQPTSPYQSYGRSSRPMQVVNTDGRIVPYGKMTHSRDGSRHPQTGRIVR